MHVYHTNFVCFGKGGAKEKMARKQRPILIFIGFAQNEKMLHGRSVRNV